MNNGKLEIGNTTNETKSKTISNIESGISKFEKLTRDEVMKRIDDGKNLNHLILTDLDLSGLNLKGKSFFKSDIRGLKLYNEEANSDARTNIEGADFTEAIIADLGDGVSFIAVDANESIFCYKEDLIVRRKRQQESGELPNAQDAGGLFGFNGCDGDFKKSKWINVDFGGGSGHEALFPGADLDSALFEGCDLSGIDFTEANIPNIQIINPVSLARMTIGEKQIESVANAIQLVNQKEQDKFLEEINKKGLKKALEDYFQITIVD